MPGKVKDEVSRRTKSDLAGVFCTHRTSRLAKLQGSEVSTNPGAIHGVIKAKFKYKPMRL